MTNDKNISDIGWRLFGMAGMALVKAVNAEILTIETTTLPPEAIARTYQLKAALEEVLNFVGNGDDPTPEEYGKLWQKFLAYMDFCEQYQNQEDISHVH